jgi:mRNA interferase MazF
MIATTICVVLTSNVRLAEAPGNVLIPARESGLPKDSVANVSQVVTVDKARLAERVGKLPPRFMRAVSEGLRLVLLSS